MAQPLLLSMLVLFTLTECSPILNHGHTAPAHKQRERRNYTPIHNYPDTVYSHIVDDAGDPGVWKKDNCTSLFNCETISPHHCTKLGSAFYCSNNQVSDSCIFDFGATLFNKDDYSGMDLALYKAKEEDLSSQYLIFITYMISLDAGQTVSSRIISSACNGWQVFHLNQFATDSLQNGYNPLQFKVIVFKNFIKGLNCQEISELFIMGNAVLPLPPWFPAVPKPDGSGDGASLGENPFSIPNDKLIDYIPALNLFYSDNASRKRRETESLGSNGVIKMERNRGKRCFRVDKMTSLQGPIRIRGEEYTILHPVAYNVGECKSDEGKWLFSGQTCGPLKRKSVELLVKKKAEKGSISINRNADIVIEECSWINNLPAM